MNSDHNIFKPKKYEEISNNLKNLSKEKINETLLHFIRKENLCIIKILLENGANINYTNVFKETPILIALIVNNWDIIKFLLKEYNPNLNIENYKKVSAKKIINNNYNLKNRIKLELGINDLLLFKK